MPTVIIISLLLLLPSLASLATGPRKDQGLCPHTCGGVSIDYPFGVNTKQGCFLSEAFQVSCDNNVPTLLSVYNHTNQANISHSHSIISDLLFPQLLRLVTNSTVAINCPHFSHSVTLEVPSPFTISSQDNRFVAVGCNSTAHIATTDGTFSSHCQARHISTSGPGEASERIERCNIEVPDCIEFVYNVTSNDPWSSGSCNMSCGVAALADAALDWGWAEDVGRRSSLDGVGPDHRGVPLMLAWDIRIGDCGKIPICGSNTFCNRTSSGLGYHCYCKEGFKGNPYLNGTGGCRVIDERCIENLGRQSCSCSGGIHLDQEKNQYGCLRRGAEAFPIIKVALGISSVLVVLLLCGFSLFYLGQKKRRLKKLKRKYFKQNGGLLLQKQISSHKDTVEATKIFTIEELGKATNNFHEQRVLGRGGHGTVYKGNLQNNRVVAIKKSKLITKIQTEQFINEVVILSNVNHRNVVKLLGCCLECKVPLLVYEYVPNGTLFHHIHGEGHKRWLSWQTRLRIAVETAEALAYLHSAASTPIFHRDVKSSNILLDENYTAKISDFGVSRLVPVDRAHVTTLVQGTLGYLDPEYFNSGQLSEKSDVYSFGVVLVELLTGKLPLSFEGFEEGINLCMYFVSSTSDNHLLDILEPRLLAEGEVEQLLAVAALAEKCLRVKGSDRPTMKEVAMELEGLRRHGQVQSCVGDRRGESNIQESNFEKKGESTQHCQFDSTGCDDLLYQEMLSMDGPR